MPQVHSPKSNTNKYNINTDKHSSCTPCTACAPLNTTDVQVHKQDTTNCFMCKGVWT